MDCPTCGTTLIAFAVPPPARGFVPGGEAAAICPVCLELFPADPADVDPDPGFDRIDAAFPPDETGALVALAVGLLVDSLALNRAAVTALFEQAIDDGADPWLILERLARSETADPDADLDRLRRQLDQLMG